MNITIIGTGVYALAMCRALSLNENNKIKMWSESSDSLESLDERRKCLPELGNLGIDDDVLLTSDYEVALKGADLVFIMCAAKYVASVCEGIRPFINEDMHFVIGSKGIEQNTCRFVHEVFLNVIDASRLAIISGPSFAIDIANLEPIGLSCATKNPETMEILKSVYEGTNVKLRGSDDLIGVELCGSIKNVIAVAAGILDGLGYSESTRSFLITESLHDIRDLLDCLGGDKSTILSFAGVGDLLLTATSVKSRNYSYGILLGKMKFDEAQEYLNKTTVEGVYTLKSIHALLDNKSIVMPVVDLIYDIVVNSENPKKLATFLMEKK